MRAAAALGIDAGALGGRGARAPRHRARRGASRFRHPLVRSAVYQARVVGERRAAHLALADALGDEAEADQRAWHRAAAALEPDDEVADALERPRSGRGAAAATRPPPPRSSARPS